MIQEQVVHSKTTTPISNGSRLSTRPNYSSSMFGRPKSRHVLAPMPLMAEERRSHLRGRVDALNTTERYCVATAGACMTRAMPALWISRHNTLPRALSNGVVNRSAREDPFQWTTEALCVSSSLCNRSGRPMPCRRPPWETTREGKASIVAAAASFRRRAQTLANFPLKQPPSE
ncbi:hypothetical protein HPB48_021328 [Haemaphysalis longicornis]|uniref:Uncharacterized protein n=1 Tax=Haemaphysalis longicornis TaxID=44386 RepID=A0A9J6GEA9_HAELO|nr:hypothetical protein HPB48_021328 [Haemaphysalis longicornis]